MGWRGDVRDSFYTALQAFAAANSSLVDHVSKSRPESITDAKYVYIGGIAETIDTDIQLRRRDAEVTLVCCAQLGENTEVVDRTEDLADALIDWLTTNYGLTGALTVQWPTRSVTTEIPDGGTFVPAVAVVALASIQQGRT